MANLATIKVLVRKLGRIRNAGDLYRFFQIPPLIFMGMILNPRYSVYEIPKRRGGVRLIEDPDEVLKTVLQHLNQTLQAVYHGLRPACVHGFCISTTHEEDRNIVSNASRHLGIPYMLNIDLKDFFHTISFDTVQGIWSRYFPHLDSECIEILTRLCCFRGRLPMGSPTSPALSNFACLDLDAELMTYCKTTGITYTRFADDLTFSEIGRAHV